MVKIFAYVTNADDRCLESTNPHAPSRLGNVGIGAVQTISSVPSAAAITDRQEKQQTKVTSRRNRSRPRLFWRGFQKYSKLADDSRPSGLTAAKERRTRSRSSANWTYLPREDNTFSGFKARRKVGI